MLLKSVEAVVSLYESGPIVGGTRSRGRRNASQLTAFSGFKVGIRFRKER